MKKNQIKIIPEYYKTYVNEVEDIELIDALKQYSPSVLKKDLEKLNKIGDRVYAEGKWTIKDILQHTADGERVFAYRALRIARNDKTPLPGFEENDYVNETTVNAMTVEELITELENLRTTTIDLFKSFDDSMLMRSGVCSNSEISVLALGFVIAGHFIHHVKVIRNKYYDL